LSIDETSRGTEPGPGDFQFTATTAFVSRDTESARKGREIHLRFPGLFFVPVGIKYLFNFHLGTIDPMNAFSLFWQFIKDCGSWFYRSTIAPDASGKSVPPIRYDDDPADIYLA